MIEHWVGGVGAEYRRLLAGSCTHVGFAILAGIRGVWISHVGTWVGVGVDASVLVLLLLL